MATVTSYASAKALKVSSKLGNTHLAWNGSFIEQNHSEDFTSLNLVRLEGHAPLQFISKVFNFGQWPPGSRKVFTVFRF